jgi:hypothetical protein
VIVNTIAPSEMKAMPGWWPKNSIPGGQESFQDRRVGGHPRQPGGGDHREPNHHHRAEDAADHVGAEALDREEAGQHRDRDRQDQRLQARHRHLHPLDRGEHRDRRGDDPVAVEKGDAEHAERNQHRLEPGAAQRHPLDQRDQGQDPALAVVVGAHDEEHELDRDDQGDRPEDERDHPEDVAFGRLHRLVVGGEDCLQGVERAGADVAEDDPERAQGEHRHAELAVGGPGSRRRGGRGFGHRGRDSPRQGGESGADGPRMLYYEREL